MRAPIRQRPAGKIPDLPPHLRIRQRRRVGSERRRPQPHLVVEIVRHFHRLLTREDRFDRQTHLDALEFPDRAVAHGLREFVIINHRAVLEAHGKQRLSRRHIVRQLAPLGDRERGLFAEHFFPRRQRHLRHRHMPIIRRRDDHRVDIGPRQQRPKIRDHRAARRAVVLVHELPRLLAPLAPHIAYRDHPAVVLLQKRLQIHPDPMRTQADEAERHLL